MKRLGDFIAYLEEQVRNGSIYVWGAQGQTKPTITEAWIRAEETSAANAKRAIALWKKRVAAGYGDVLRAFDCSGLGMYYLQNIAGLYKGDMSSNTMLGKCTKITLADVKRGDWLFRVYTSGANKGKAYHIGYMVSDTEFVEAKGRDDGVVKRKLADARGYWNAAGRPEVFEDEINAPVDGEHYLVCVGATVNVRTGPGKEYPLLLPGHTAIKGQKLLGMRADNGWWEIGIYLDGAMRAGYISGDAKYVQVVEV